MAISRTRQLSLFQQYLTAAIVVVVLVCTLVSIVGYGMIKEGWRQYQADIAFGIVRNIVPIIEVGVVRGDLAGIEHRLVALSSIIDIESVQVLNSEGVMLVEVQREEGRLQPTYRSQVFVLPSSVMPEVLSENERLELRYPVRIPGIGRPVWVHLVLNAREAQHAAWEFLGLMFWLGGALLLLMTAMFLVVNRGWWQQFQKTTDYIQKLPSSEGAIEGLQKNARELVMLEKAITGAYSKLVDNHNLLERKTAQLKLKVKQLGCVYMTSKILSDPALLLESKFEAVVKLLPSVLQSPDQAHGKLVYLGRTFASENYKECVNSISEALKVGQQYVGMLELGLDSGKGKKAVFMRDEVELLRDVAFRINQLLKQEEVKASVTSMNRELDRRVKERTYELEKAREIAERASSAKSDFLSSVSHEFKTPMNAVVGFSDLVLEDSENMTEAQKESVQCIRESGMHMLRLIDSVLRLSWLDARNIPMEYTVIEPGVVIYDAIDIVKPQAEMREVTIEVEIQSDMGPVRMERELVGRIVTNVLENAVKFNRQGGRVTIVASMHEDLLEISVKDTGRGIDKHMQERIFEPFYRVGTGEISDGAGVGLSEARRLLEFLHGTITVISESGKGSEFVIILPVMELEEQA